MAEHVHGKSGLDGPDLADPVTRPVPMHAVDFLAERILASSEPVTLIPVGHLTNIALLLEPLSGGPWQCEPDRVDGRCHRYRQHHTVRRVQHLRRSGGSPPGLSLRAFRSR